MMAFFNAVLVISSLTLAPLGLFVNAIGEEYEPYVQYGADPLQNYDEPYYEQPPLDHEAIGRYNSLMPMQNAPVEYNNPGDDNDYLLPADPRLLRGSSDLTIPATLNRFGYENALDVDRMASGGIATGIEPNVNYASDQLQNYPEPGSGQPPLDYEAIDRHSTQQKPPVENTFNADDDEDLDTRPFGNSQLQQRIGLRPSNVSVRNHEFVDYDFDVMYDDAAPLEKKQDAPLPPAIRTADRAAAEPMDETLSASTKKPVTVDYPESMEDDFDETTTATTTTAAAATTVAMDATTKDIISAWYGPDETDDSGETLTVSKTTKADTTPKVPHRMGVNNTDTTAGVTATTPAGDVTTDDDDNDDDTTDAEVQTLPSVAVAGKNPISCQYGTDKNPYPVPNIIRTGRRVSDIKCEEYMWHFKYKIIDAESNSKTCARLMKMTQIVGGRKSNEGQFPHMGAIGWTKADNSVVYMCGASLISVRFSITAGHCRALPGRGQVANILNANPSVVRFGSVDLKNDDDTIDMKIDEFIIMQEFKQHPHWKYNDIGLVRFTEDVPISKFVRPACLWDGHLRGYSTGMITGWGQTKSGLIQSTSSHLQYAEVDFLNKPLCRTLLDHRNNRQWRNGLVDSQFCAGKLQGGVDSCQGDSGGPIQVKEPLLMDSSFSMFHVVGLTNFGIKCAEPKIPGVYTNVTHFLCWIEKTVWPNEVNKLCSGP